jgi:hypothetical protein
MAALPVVEVWFYVAVQLQHEQRSEIWWRRNR